ncbi:16S rRNA (adenine(1518)-N(6)/adenine(1519)-N(6))-dimethyltransferase RsmA [Sulfuriroseicoccus oceanibius]|uniref:Ribosomal RNA small subunit methyltransferase A n=1 Tax=Sulfuriroseicoccus oceanibius TaxID=2707525 RepID=A0A6B3L2R9_9BACT|nr:16S rRNA (adenine(1518)-N(6)/adenine(1519)-N(6))-dimethyltransferase RsmA [Sulfuriroseicoccus oceanibius]QQL46143.1 ribosomal RNA small subunit methyltransferase A [Sulfuriroseicoccus oceanibius]
MNLTQIKERLIELDVQPSRAMGQNFLHDENSARWIADQLNVSADDCVVEVGPGTGALTEHVVGKCRKLILVEFDRRLAEGLMERFADREDVVVHHCDAVRFDVRMLYKERPVKFIGNLPYSCGGEIIRNFLSSPSPIEKAVLMLQHEVIERLAATPGNKNYGVFTLRTQAYWNVQSIKKLGPELFHPRPKIDSSVALLTPIDRASRPAFNPSVFDRVIRTGFSQRRKQLRKLMQPLLDGRDWADVVAAIGSSESVRAEELPLSSWITLTNLFDPHPLKHNPQSAAEVFDVVDDNDEVIGTATRGEVHEKQLKHRAVHVFLFDKKGNLLLQKRSHLKDVHPQTWDSSAAGHLDSGEDYATSAAREVVEETGLEGVELQEVGKLPPSDATGWEFVTLFRGNYRGKPEFPASEVEAMLAFPLDEIRAWVERCSQDFATGFLECFRLFEEKEG